MTTTHILKLIPIDDKLLAALKVSPRKLEESIGASIGQAVDVLGPVMEQTLLLFERRPRAAEWGCFLVSDTVSAELVGTCGYKDGPAPDSSVEIAYFTFPEFEEQGYGTAMATEFVNRAGSRAVIAHTLPERNASCRVLEQSGFSRTGEVVDPEDGPVWRWVRHGTDRN